MLGQVNSAEIKSISTDSVAAMTKCYDKIIRDFCTMGHGAPRQKMIGSYRPSLTRSCATTLKPSTTSMTSTANISWSLPARRWHRAQCCVRTNHVWSVSGSVPLETAFPQFLPGHVTDCNRVAFRMSLDCGCFRHWLALDGWLVQAPKTLRFGAMTLTSRRTLRIMFCS